MTFIEKNLANNERILYMAKLHWWIYGKGILLLLIAIAVIIFTKGKTTGLEVATGLGLIGLIALISAYVHASSSEFAVTNRRVMFKTGVVNRKLIELQLNRAEGLRIDQGIWGRILNYGTLIVTSGGITEDFTPIADPYEFKKQINNAIEGSFGNTNPLTI